VVLLNGGGQAESNYFSHHLFIEMLHENLTRRGIAQDRITLFSTDGEDTEADRFITESPEQSWLFEELPEHQMVIPSRLQNTTFAGQTLHRATRDEIRRFFRAHQAKLRKRTDPSTLFLFVTDHGTKGEGPFGNKIELWHEQLNVSELRQMLEPLGQKNRVVTVMSQCFSGGFAKLLYSPSGRVHGNRCGFFSTLPNREAYGCFPETARANRVGHAYRMIQAMQRAKSFVEAHRQTLLTDETPDVPLSTSDVYLHDQLRLNAKRRNTSLLNESDRWLKKLWQAPPASFLPDIRLLRRVQQRFALPHHQLTQSVWKAIHANRKRQKSLQKLEEYWEQVLNEMRRGSLLRYYQRQPEFAALIQKELRRPELDEKSFAMGKQLLERYQKHLTTDAKAEGELLRGLYRRYLLVHKKIYYLHVREAALLRIRTLLTRLAGRLMIEQKGGSSHKRDLQALLSCEATSLGDQLVADGLRAEEKGDHSKPDPFLTKIDEEAQRIPFHQLHPAFLGIAFQPAPQGWDLRFGNLAPGAAVITEVMEDSPAAKAGLKVGDTILSIGGQMLSFVGEIRTLVMLADPGKKVFFLVSRNKKYLTIPVEFVRYYASEELLALNDEPSPPGQITPPSRGEDTRPNLPAPKRPQRTSPSAKSLLTDLDGKTLPLPAPTQATLLFFWATWCEGCKAMVPMLREIQKRYRTQGLTIYAVTTDEASMLRPFQRRWGKRFPFQIAIDVDGAMNRREQIDSIPQFMLYDRQGKRTLRITLPTVGFEKRLEEAIQALLSPKTPHSGKNP
jgi:thiol-disulfide isomerase/thioredoxin/signal transduction histidine kinase